MICPHCGSAKFRASKLRVLDLPRLLILRYPVRCRICYKRKFVGILLAMKVRRADKIRHEEVHRRRKIEASSNAEHI